MRNSWYGVAQELSKKLEVLVRELENIYDEMLSDEDYEKLDNAYSLAKDCSDTASMMADNIDY